MLKGTAGKVSVVAVRLKIKRIQFEGKSELDK